MAIITIFPNLSSRTNNVIFILLTLLAFILLAGSAAYVVLKGIALYKEHRATEALARKVLDTEARRIDVSSPTEDKKKTELFSLVPSLPPVIPPPLPRDAPHAGNTRAIARSFSYGRTQMIVAGRGGRGVSPFHVNASVMIQCVESGRPALPWVGSGDDDGRGDALPVAQQPDRDVPKARRSASVDRRAGMGEVADKRKVLGPLSVVELERRRSGNGKGMGKGKGRKRNGPRVVGKENVVLCEGVGVGGRRARSVDGGVLSGYYRQ